MAVDIRKALNKFKPFFLQAQAENLNEADTSMRITKFFEQVLEYDAMTEISREKQLKGTFVDLTIKIDGVIKFFIEIKSASTTLRDRHIEQAQRYAAEGNIPWVLLTNGVVWNFYHLTFDEGIEYEKAFSANLADPDDLRAPDLLGLLHKKAIRKGEHDAFWLRRAALSPESISRAIFTEDTLQLIRREIRRSENLLVDEEDLANAIQSMFSPETRENIGPVRIRRKRKVARSKRDNSADATVDNSSSATEESQEPVAPPG